MTIVITLAAFSVLAIVFLTGYRYGKDASCGWCKPTDPDNSTPIYDQLAADKPTTALKLVAPIDVEISE
jgi:hypothetical protein